jgi:hypothetical protein
VNHPKASGGLRPHQLGPQAPDPDSLSLPHTDWLRHDLVVSGPADEVTILKTAAWGAGGIPWADPDADLAEEDRIHALVHPPDGSQGLSVAAARALARALRDAGETRQQRALSAAGRSRACPFDLHALLPVPDTILALGPDDPASRAWLRTNWGTSRPLRHVRLSEEKPDRRLRRTARVKYEFWAADWTPWAAVRALRARFTALVLDLQPDYRDG